MVELLTSNQRVAGSSPASCSKDGDMINDKYHLPKDRIVDRCVSSGRLCKEWLKAICLRLSETQVCKSLACYEWSVFLEL